MAKTITLRLDDATYRELKRRADASKSRLSNFIETAALRYAREADFASDEEVASILANDALVRRLRRGTREAKRRRGRHVD